MVETVAKKKKVTAANLRFERDKDREPVKGIFKFYEVPGGTMSFVYRKYKEDEVESFTLIDGQMYTLPLGVAKHLNKNGWYPQYEHVPGDPGMLNAGPSFNPGQNMRISKKIRRFGFQSLEFVDVDDLSEEGGEIVQVEFEKKV